MDENDSSIGKTSTATAKIKSGWICRQFLLADIKTATADFSDEHLIGRGGFGKVYKGLIDNCEQIVAIKRLDSTSKQGEHEFMTEIQTLTELRHDNLVSLVGYCNENGEMILVYEYMECGTLADYLFGNIRRNSSSFLSLIDRLVICIQAGRGLDYLHTGRSLIHRDIKASNILLDKDFTAKVSDFGLAKYFTSNKSETHVSTMIKGTLGYIDPYYYFTGRLTMKSDTYAFGVVLLEILTGKPVLDNRIGEDDPGLILWAREQIRKGKSIEIVDPVLRSEISYDSLKVFVKMVERCLHHEPKKRPKMAQVVLQLEYALELQERSNKTKSRFWSIVALWNLGRPARKNEILEPEELVKEKLTTANAQQLEVSLFSWKQLKRITKNFSATSVIDVGSSGTTYHGVLKTGEVVAVKKLNCWGEEHDFDSQVSITYNLRHPNMVELIGYCVHDNSKFLVYEYAKHGSLSKILHRNGINLADPVPILTWAQRVKIALDTAKGLQHIHRNEKVHHGLKSNNILLFDDYNAAKVTDFGFVIKSALPKVGDPFDYHPSQMAISSGYEPPEYSCTGWRGDVYSFGVVLLELITGRKALDENRSIHEHILVYWAKPMLEEGKVERLLDPRLDEAYKLKLVHENMALIAKSCLEYDPENRPEIGLVVEALQSLSNTLS